MTDRETILETALKLILLLRPPGPCRSKLVEQIETIAKVALDEVGSRTELGLLDKSTAETVLKLGHPYPTIGHLAFDDMHSDDIILSHSGVHLTAGDVRGLQVLLLTLGFTSPDRLTSLQAEAADIARQAAEDNSQFGVGA